MRDPTTLGQKVAELRHARGFSMVAAARRAGMSDALWSNVENGKGRPSVPYIRAIADVVGADRAELLDLAGYPEAAAIDREATRPDEPPHWLRAVELVDPEMHRRIEDMALAALVRHGALSSSPGGNPDKVARLTAAAIDELRRVRDDTRRTHGKR